MRQLNSTIIVLASFVLSTTVAFGQYYPAEYAADPYSSGGYGYEGGMWSGTPGSCQEGCGPECGGYGGGACGTWSGGGGLMNSWQGGTPSCDETCDPGYPSGRLGVRMPRGCRCGGAGCELCRKTGLLRPGYLRAAAFGWISPNGCAGCSPDGNIPGSSPYPYPWNGDCWADCGMPGGYQNYGDTCCGPYWYDFLVEGVFLTREGSTNVGLISDGIRGIGPPNLVLSSDSADLGYEPGYRITGRYQMDAVYNLEATYMGALDWSDTAQVVSANNTLYSVFSDFGNTPLGGFEETDQARQAAVETRSELDSVEVSYRRSWIAPNYRVNGSWFVGARYLRLEDALNLSINVVQHFDPINMVQRGPAASAYNVRVVNDLVGPQLGTSLVRCLIPGVVIGGDAKAGVYGNAADQNTLITSTGFANPIVEAFDETDVAFASEGRAYAIWQFHPLMKLRGGYEVLFLSGVATGSSNFNPVLPLGPGITRAASLDDDDQALFHGANFGLEIGW